VIQVSGNYWHEHVLVA